MLGYLDSVFRVVATSVHIKTSMHATAEITSLRDRAGHGEPNQRCIVNTALIQSPVSRGLNGVRPELKHPCGYESEQHHREKGDVVYAVLGFHPRNKSWAPRAVFTRGIHG